MRTLTCIICPNSCKITAEKDGGGWVIKGNLCPRGGEFAIREMTDPKRTLCSTVKTSCPGYPRAPVRTDGEIPMDKIPDVMKVINRMRITNPAACGEVLIENVCGTGVNIISTSDMREVFYEKEK